MTIDLYKNFEDNRKVNKKTNIQCSDRVNAGNYGIAT